MSIEKIERLSNLMADYKERFGKQVPLHVLFHNIDTIIMLVEKALETNAEMQ